ncbi:MFS transporter [Pseudoduganella umbonata]|uniref:MFS transporter n=1 Tax=Pseudoduganella umbonata TaxID=864828 RepID=A0A4P8HMN0_9BURK|nr:MFS transporter [Pseudoduganella umbonata]MBB3219524.1 inositol transporter-like SP family MFS transporter [Pseudoduganella umbonata]QCP09600.1 MFS transporter [Pseudoduganella umbonata]
MKVETMPVPRLRDLPRAAWRVAILAGMASYLDAAAIITSGGALVLYKDRFGLSLGQIGQLSAVLTALFAIGALVGGRLGDRFGRRRVFTTTMVGLALGTAMLAFAPSLPVLYAGTIVVGFCIGADLPVSMAMIAEEAPPGFKGRLIAFSHVLWMAAIGTTYVLQIFVGGLGELGGRIMWAHVLAVALLVLALRATLPESGEWTRARADADAGPDGSVPGAGSMRELFGRRFVGPFIALALFYGVFNLAANTGGQFGTLLYTEVARTSVSTAGLVNTAQLAVSFTAAILFMRTVDLPSRMTWFVLGGALAVAGQLAPLVFGVNVFSLAAWQILQGIGGAFAGESMWKVWSQELFPTLLRSTAQGATTFFTRMLAAVAALGTPLLIESGPATLFMTLTVAVSFTTALGWLYIRRLPAAALQ